MRRSAGFELRPQSVWNESALNEALRRSGVANIGLHMIRIWQFLIRHPTASWGDIVGLPKAAVEVLESDFVVHTSTVSAVQRSTNGETMKLLMKLQDGHQVESVIMLYDTRSKVCAPGQGNVRATLCVSSQVGCIMGCTFCATGTMGFQANLTAGEIVEQLHHASQLTSIRNVCFMGMGEPLNNYKNVKAALCMMLDSRLFSLCARQVTVSSVGVIDKIGDLAADFPQISFALSLHAPTQELRERIVPSARAYKLPRLLDAMRKYQEATGSRIFVEYVMLAGVNDGAENARLLGGLLVTMAVHINLIPWNPVLSPGFDFAAPDDAAIQDFHAILRHEFKLPCTIRREKGQEISGACGQLVVSTGCSRAKGTADIEELAGRLAAKAM